MAKLTADRYAFRGPDSTRSFVEWRLVAELRRRSLPVPAPLATRYVRHGWTYCADLITERLPASFTLADAITGAAVPVHDWCEIGRTLALFHRHGVQHADLNANNILLAAPAANGQPRAVYLLDFDRGRLRSRGAWEEQVLARLHRSLCKVRRQRPQVVFTGG